MIKVIATGNLGNDAELKQIDKDLSVLNFAIASNKKIKGKDVTTWLNCQKWNSEKLAPYLTKGTKVVLFGELEIRKGKDEKFYTTMNVNELEFVGGSGQSTKKEETGLPESESQTDEQDNDLPF